MSKYDEYAEIIGEKFELGLIDEIRFYLLLLKISEWELREDNIKRMTGRLT